MQQISPRKYFETRLRQLPMYKCLVNENWEDEKIANVMVLRSHVNGNVSGAIFLVDLLCLGVKDVAWYFNTDPEELMEFRSKASLTMVEIPYELAHNIVYAGLEFAQEYDIKPHADFAIARYALEEDDESIELIDIETGEDGIPHLIERHPGQYADAHSKLKKAAGPGNFKISQVFDSIEEADETEADWEAEMGHDGDEITLKDIDIDDLTVFAVMKLPNDDLLDSDLISSRSELEQMKISVERLLRLYESFEDEPGFISDTLGLGATGTKEIQRIKILTEDDLAESIPFPYGVDEDDYEQGMDDFFSLMHKMPDYSLEDKAANMAHLLQTTGKHNPLVLAHCIFYLLIDENGPILLETIQPYIHSMNQYPMIALAQTFLVTAEPEKFHQPPVLKSDSPLLKEVCDDYLEFSAEEFCLFYALRCLQAAKQQHFPLVATWYRMMAGTEESDIYLGMLTTLFMRILEGADSLLKKVDNQMKGVEG